MTPNYDDETGISRYDYMYMLADENSGWNLRDSLWNHGPIQTHVSNSQAWVIFRSYYDEHDWNCA